MLIYIAHHFVYALLRSSVLAVPVPGAVFLGAVLRSNVLPVSVPGAAVQDV